MSLPRELSLDAQGRLLSTPVSELQAARGTHHHMADTTIPVDGLVLQQRGEAFEFLAEIDLQDATSVELRVRCSPDGAEQTSISYDRTTGRLSLDREHSSLDPEVERTSHSGELPLDSDELLRLHVFLDHSAIEIFANDRTVLTSRIYPTRDDSQGIVLQAHDGNARLDTLHIWEMQSIWEQ